MVDSRPFEVPPPSSPLTALLSRQDIRKSSGWFESSKTHSRKVTVGVLSKFVSNYNVRVTLTGGEREGDAGKFLKRNVTKRVRDIKGGDGSVVEALTLRYRTEAEGEVRMRAVSEASKEQG